MQYKPGIIVRATDQSVSGISYRMNHNSEKKRELRQRKSKGSGLIQMNGKTPRRHGGTRNSRTRSGKTGARTLRVN